MNKPKFTGGEWRATRIDSHAFNIRSGESSIALVYTQQGSPALMDRDGEGEANAALIAAAPALYAACAHIIERWTPDNLSGLLGTHAVNIVNNALALVNTPDAETGAEIAS